MIQDCHEPRNPMSPFETSFQESDVIGHCLQLIDLMLQLKTDYFLYLIVIMVHFIWSLDIL